MNFYGFFLSCIIFSLLFFLFSFFCSIWPYLGARIVVLCRFGYCFSFLSCWLKIDFVEIWTFFYFLFISTFSFLCYAVQSRNMDYVKWNAHRQVWSLWIILNVYCCLININLISQEKPRRITKLHWHMVCSETFFFLLSSFSPDIFMNCKQSEWKQQQQKNSQNKNVPFPKRVMIWIYFFFHLTDKITQNVPVSKADEIQVGVFSFNFG